MHSVRPAALRLCASPHFHTLVPDGVWALGGRPGSLAFHELSPSAIDLEDIALSLAASIRRYLRRRGRLGEDGEVLGDDNQDPGALQRLFEKAARDRRRLCAPVTDPYAIRRILEHLDLPYDLPALAPARDPPLGP